MRFVFWEEPMEGRWGVGPGEMSGRKETPQ